MNHGSTQRICGALSLLMKELGPDTSLRQALAFLHVALAGSAGTDATTLQKQTESSQAATSRALKMFAVDLGITEFFLDPADGRLRLVRLSTKGNKLATKIAALL